MHDGSIYFVQKLKFNLEWNVLSGTSTIHWSLWRIWRSMTSSDFQGMSSWILQPQWAEHFFRASFKKISCSILSKWWLQYFFSIAINADFNIWSPSPVILSSRMKTPNKQTKNKQKTNIETNKQCDSLTVLFSPFSV